MNKIIIILLFSLSHSVLAAPIVVPVGPAADADCQFNSVQAAIDSGTINMDIRISQQLDTLDGISIVDKDVRYVRGGYANCQDAINGVVSPGGSSFIRAANNPAINIEYFLDNFHQITFQNLLVGFAPEAVKISNGGVSVDLIIDFDGVDLKSGSLGLVTNGTGIVVNFDNGSIFDFSSGGVDCTDSQLNFGEFVAIHDNNAIRGGGIYANHCAITLDAGDNNPVGSINYGVFKNTAQNSGAGIALTSSSTLIAIGTSEHPVSISNNGAVFAGQAVTRGGAIYMESGSIAQLGQIRLDNNVAFSQGAAIYMNHSLLANPAPQLQMGRTTAYCSYGPICNSMSFNQTSDVALNAANGAVIYQNGGTMVVTQTIFQGNSAVDNALFYVENNGTLGFLSSLLINNSTQGDFFDMKNQSFLTVHYDTLADNQTSNYFNVQYDNNNGQTLEVVGSILKNGAATIANLNNDNGNHDAQVVCSLIENDDATGVVQNDSLIGLPSFVGNGNYQLQQDSLGLESACAVIGEFDLVRYDIVNTDRITGPNTGPIPDLGAYQMGYLFQDGFE